MDNPNALPFRFEQRIVTADELDMKNYVPRAISPEILQALRDLKITALEGLLGDNWASEFKTLLDRYWEDKA